MKEFLSKIIESDFMPHGHCYFWKPEILWLNVGGDALIMMAYYSLPFMLFYFAKKRTDLTHRYVFMLFAAFIFACGTTHLIDIWTVWVPTYRLEGVVKVLTGLLSISTAIVVYKSVPVLLSLPSQEQLRLINVQLRQEVRERELAQEALRLSHEQLEQRVAERTQQLLEANQELEKEIAIRRAAEESLLHKNRELEKINNDLDNFVYSASHDLKAPIINMSGLLEVLGEEMPAPTATIANLLSRMEKSLNMVNRTIYDLTEVSSIQRMEELVQSHSGIVPVLEEVKESLQDVILHTGATLVTDMAEDLQVPLSSRNLRSVLYNLLSNAIKYRHPNRKPVIQITAKVQEDYLLLSVADNGLGINLNNDEQKLFVLFKRLHDHVDGSGVGLYIVKRILDNHKATIEVASKLGEGTTFSIRFPKVELQ